jgi:beta-1,4-mannosyltransferase
MAPSPVASARDPIRVARLPFTTDRNPYQAMLYGHLANEGVDLVGDATLTPEWLLAHRGLVDVLHIHWRLDRLLPRGDDAAGSAAVADRLRLARDLGYLVVWTVHEPGRVFGDTEDIECRMAHAIADEVDLVLTHDRATAQIVRSHLGSATRIVVTGLGHYAGVYPVGPPVGEARRLCGLAPDTPTILAFGHHRPDKELPLVWRALAADPDLDLQVLVAGEVDHVGTAEMLQDAAAADPRIRLWLTRLDDHEVALVHAAADAVVVARSREWTPSSLVLSLSLGVPVVAADLATSREHGGPGVWWFEPGDALSMAAALRRVTSDPDRTGRGAAGRAHVMRSSGSDVARRTAGAMARLVARRRTGAPVVGRTSTPLTA